MAARRTATRSTRWRRSRGILFTVVSIQVEYRAPARLDDELDITCEPRAEGAASLRFAQRIYRTTESGAQRAALLVEAEVRVACVDAGSLRPRRLPQFLRAAMAAETAGMAEPLSVLRLIAQASIPVQIVIALLLLASLSSWAIIFRKRRIIGRARREADRFERRFWSGDDLSSSIARSNRTAAPPAWRASSSSVSASSRVCARGATASRAAAGGLATGDARGTVEGNRPSRA